MNTIYYTHYPDSSIIINGHHISYPISIFIINVLKMSYSPQGIKLYRAIGQSRFWFFVFLNCFVTCILISWSVSMIWKTITGQRLLYNLFSNLALTQWQLWWPSTVDRCCLSSPSTFFVDDLYLKNYPSFIRATVGSSWNLEAILTLTLLVSKLVVRLWRMERLFDLTNEK